MPKPYLFRRPSGLFCRFLVPVDLRDQVGTRFIVRALRTSEKSQAALLAAILSVALKNIFERMRHGESVDFKKLLSQTPLLQRRDLTVGKVTSADGVVFENVQIDNADDLRHFDQLLRSGNFQPLLPPPSTNKDSPARNGGLLRDRIDRFLLQRERGLLSAKNLADAKFALLGLLLPLCGNKPLNDIGSDDADTVMDALLKWPSNASKKPDFKGLSVHEILVKAQLVNAPLIGPRTVEKYLDRLRAFFSWCENQGYLTGRNPFSQRRLMTKDTREQTQKQRFSEEDLQRIFSPELRKTCDEPHKFWCPLIGLFSGMRVNEIAQLYVDDVYQIGDIWLLKVIADKPDKKIKNKASERAVPVHTTLLDLGFLEYVNDVRAHGFARLFPNLPYSPMNGYGDAVSDWFNGRYLRPAAPGSKALRAGIADPEKSFHSLRHVVINRLYSVTREILLIAEITGHTRGNNVLTNVYLDPIEAQLRAESLNQIAYPLLTFSAYQKGQFDGYFKRLNRKTLMKAASRSAPDKVETERKTNGIDKGVYQRC